MKKLILLSALVIVFLAGCKINNSVEIFIRDPYTNKTEKSFTVNSNDLFNFGPNDSIDKRIRQITEIISQANRLVLDVSKPLDLFDDGDVDYMTNINCYGYKDGELAKYYSTTLCSSCNKNTILSPKMSFLQSTGHLYVTTLLNPLIKSAITKKAAAYDGIDKVKVTFINAETNDSTDAKGFFKTVETAAKRKRVNS